jgi:CIC family chloride channel protein
LLWLKQGGIAGGGYRTLALALDGSLPVRVMLALCGLKLAATVCSYSSGGAGGIFAPALFIGGMLGGAVGFLDVTVFHHPHGALGAFALVGMGAVFAGIVRAPMTSVLIIFEMTGAYELILPLMIANMISYTLARRWRPTPIYEALLLQDGISLPREHLQTIPTQDAPAEKLP